MKQLISIKQTEFNGIQKQTVNARELHQFLESKQQFADWIKNRLIDFKVNIDYILVSQNYETSTGGTIRKEAYLTLETAKHIAMIERNEKGKQIRDYFISVEEEFKKQQFNIPKLNANFMRQIADKMAELEQQHIIDKNTIIEQHKQITVFNIFTNEDGGVCLQKAGKTLHLHPNKFIERLREKGYLSAKNNLPIQKYINDGLFTVKPFVYENNEIKLRRDQTLMTPKGFYHFACKVPLEYQDIMNATDKKKILQELKTFTDEYKQSQKLIKY